MIYVTTPLKGRLGNHLFLIGAIYTFAEKNNYQPVFSWEWTSNEAKNKSLLLSDVNFVDHSVTSKFPNVIHNYFSFRKIPKLHKSCCITGKYCFFQDIKYLNRDLLIKLYLVPHLKKSVLGKYKDINERTSIHVRRGDYVSRENIGSNQFTIPSAKYYQEAIEICEAKKLIVFSDDLEWCKKNIKFDDIIYSNDSEDFSITAMSMCKNNIISASTFGWWGAYLNTNKNSKVVAPNSWFKSYSEEVKKKLAKPESNLIPQSWIRINPYEKINLRIGIRLKKFRRSVVSKLKKFIHQKHH